MVMAGGSRGFDTKCEEYGGFLMVSVTNATHCC